MHKQTHPISCPLPASNQDSDKPSMAWQQGADEPTGRPSGGADDDAVIRTRTGTGAGDGLVPSAPADDFEFCILSSGGLAQAGDDAADMCVADEVFSGGKLLPLRLSSADAAPLLLLRSDSLDGAATAASASTTSTSSGFSFRSVSRSSSSCVSRSTSSSSASSEHAGPGGSSSSKQSASSADAAAVRLPPRRSMSGSVFYAHPSPSPRPPPRRSRTAAAPSAPRRSTGSAPPASWGVIRLGVVGAPEVYAYAPRSAEYRKLATARSGSGSGGGSRSARFEPQHGTADKKLALGLLGAGLVCSCSPDAVAPVDSAEVAAAEARRRRKKKAEEKKKKRSAATAEQSVKGTARRSRILEWLEDLSISKEKSAVSSCR